MTAPLPVFVVEPDPWLALEVESMLRESAVIPTDEVIAVADVGELRDFVADRGMVVLGPSHLDDDTLGELAALHDQRPALRFVLTSNGRVPVVPVTVAAAGPDALVPAHDDQGLRAGLRRALTRAEGLEVAAPREIETAEQPETRRGRVYTVCSPTGGCGKTFFATNLAHLLTTTLAGSVVIVDLDLQFGEVDTALGMRPPYTIMDLMALGDDDEVIASLWEITAEHSSGLRVLASPDDPSEVDRIKPQEVAHLVDLLAQEFDYVVLDTPTGLSEPVLATMDHCDHMFVMAALDISSLRNLRLFLQTLSRLGLPGDDISVLLNKEAPDIGIAADEVEEFFEDGFAARLPFSREVSLSMNSGRPVVAVSPAAEVSRALARSAMDFMPPRSAGYVQERLDDFESRSVTGWLRRRLRPSGYRVRASDGTGQEEEIS